MISIVSQNCNGFINRNAGDSRARMLAPLSLLLGSEMFEKAAVDLDIYRKSCDLYHSIANLPETDEYKRFSLIADELQMKYADKSLKRYGLLSEEELRYILDFIDIYGGFRVF